MNYGFLNNKYYTSYYNKIYLIIRTDSNKIINFYTKIITNLEIIYIDKNILDNSNIIEYLNKNNLSNCDYLFHGCHDNKRKDKYINNFRFIDNCFVKGFYECYDIPYITRINHFIFTRNNELEEQTYNSFINLYGYNYILYHEVIENYDRNKIIINLNGLSSIFFDYIKVLENSIEIHLLDSVWGAFVYLLDAKYMLFQNKKIFLYAKRGHKRMFEEPIKLDNWTII